MSGVRGYGCRGQVAGSLVHSPLAGTQHMHISATPDASVPMHTTTGALAAPGWHSTGAEPGKSSRLPDGAAASVWAAQY